MAFLHHSRCRRLIVSNKKNQATVRKQLLYRIMSSLALGLIFVDPVFQLYDT
jgi:hypothetical protein